MEISAKASSNFSFFSSMEYYTELIRQLRQTKKGDRVLLMTMTFEPTEPTIHEVTKELRLAADRGVSVRIGIDAHTFLLGNGRPGPLWLKRDLPARVRPYYRDKLEFLQHINQTVQGFATVINKPGQRLNLPIAGRSHIKIAIINNTVFVGGCNLENAQWVDLMSSWQDKASADWLYTTLSKVLQAGNAREALGSADREFRLDDDSSLFIDSGVRSQSIIFDEALALIDAAEKWLLITCQYFPNSITARHLLAAHRRGVKLEIIFAHPRHQGLVGSMGQHYSILRERTRVPRSFFTNALGRRDPKLHAKLIASDAGVMIGSHNYVRAGVALGTAEIALLSRSQKNAKLAVNTLREALKTAGIKRPAL